VNESVLAERTHAFVRGVAWQAAVLPFGATEPHNLHMPYGTDTFQVEELGRRACHFAWDRGARVALLPTMAYGVNTNHLGIPGALACSVTPTTLLALIADLAESLERQNVRKLVLLNGHGGNELKPLTRQLHHRSGVFLCVCDWYRMARDVYPGLFERPGEHADEVESSLGLAFFPQWMRMELAGPGTARPTRFEAVNRGWISLTRPWHLLTADTGVGDPSAASVDKGRRLMDVLTERLGGFLAELACATLDETFPF
jgi:creatinine amidohydrolase